MVILWISYVYIYIYIYSAFPCIPSKKNSLTCSPPAHEVNPSLSPTAFARRHELVVLRAQAETTRDRRVVGVDGGDAFHGVDAQGDCWIGLRENLEESFMEGPTLYCQLFSILQFF